MLMSVGGTLKIRNAGLTVPSERGCAGADCVLRAAMVNVVVVEYWYPAVVVRGFYTVVVVLSVVSNQTQAVASPRDSTNRHVVVASVSKTDTGLPIETTPDHYECVEVVNARVPFRLPKYLAPVWFVWETRHWLPVRLVSRSYGSRLSWLVW